MKLIGELCDFVEDELGGVVAYANMAVHYKSENKELADMFFDMANSEATHLRSIHAWIVKLIDKTKRDGEKQPPQGMLDVWTWKHRKLVQKFSEAEVALQSYTKM